MFAFVIRLVVQLIVTLLTAIVTFIALLFAEKIVDKLIAIHPIRRLKSRVRKTFTRKPHLSVAR